MSCNWSPRQKCRSPSPGMACMVCREQCWNFIKKYMKIGKEITKYARLKMVHVIVLKAQYND